MNGSSRDAEPRRRAAHTLADGAHLAVRPGEHREMRSASPSLWVRRTIASSR